MKKIKQLLISALKKPLFWYCIILFVFAFLMGILLPLGGDDWNNYLNGQCSFDCIIRIAQSAYMTFEGRFFSRICDSLFVPHQLIWAFTSAGMLTFVYYALIKIINPKKTFIMPLLLLSLLLVDAEAFAQVYVWKTGNITYFFPLFFTIFLIWYKKDCFKVDKKDKWYMFLILPIITFFFSMFVENMTVGIITICGFFIVLKLIKNKKMDWLMFICFLISIFGLILMITSPGTQLRLSESTDFSELSLIGKFIYNVPTLINYTFIKNSFLILILSFTMILLINKIKGSKLKIVGIIFVTVIPIMTSLVNFITYVLGSDIRIVHRLLNAENWYIMLYWIIFIFLFLFLVFKYYRKEKIILFIILALVGNGSMMISPIWGGRTAYLTTLALYVVCIMVLNNEKISKEKFLEKISIFGISSFIILFLIYCVYYRIEVNNRDEYINWQLKNEKEVIEIIILPRYHVWNINPWGDGHHAKMFKSAHNIKTDIIMTKKREISNSNFK